MFKTIIIANSAAELSRKILELAEYHGHVTKPAWMQEPLPKSMTATDDHIQRGNNALANALFAINPISAELPMIEVPEKLTPQETEQMYASEPVVPYKDDIVPGAPGFVAASLQPVAQPTSMVVDPVTGQMRVTEFPFQHPAPVQPTEPNSSRIQPEPVQGIPNVLPFPTTPLVNQTKTTNQQLEVQIQADQKPVETTSAASFGELDKDGLPWDARIHSKNKGKNTDGTWRLKRGVQDDVLVQVTRELQMKTTGGQPAPTAAPVVPSSPAPVHQQPVAPPVPAVPSYMIPVEQPPVQPVVAPPPVYENLTVPSHGKPAHTFESFVKNFAAVLNDLIAQKKINREYIKELNNYFKVADIWDIMKDEAKMRECFNGLIHYGYITGL